MIFKFGGQLQPVEIEEWEAERSPAVFVTDARHAEETLARAGIIYENEIRLEKIGFCKIENQQECMVGTFCIPKLLDVLGSRYRMYMFVNEDNVVIVDDETFSERLISRIKRKRMHQGETKERFLYNYIAEFMSRDLEILVAYERRLLRMEEDVSQDHTDTIQNRLMPIRRELLNLRSYYDEMMDLTKELEEKQYTATAGGGAVSVTVSGKKEVVAVKISPEAVDPDDVEMLEDLIVAATNEAFHQMEAESSAVMSELTGGLGNLGGLSF